MGVGATATRASRRALAQKSGRAAVCAGIGGVDDGSEMGLGGGWMDGHGHGMANGMGLAGLGSRFKAGSARQ